MEWLKPVVVLSVMLTLAACEHGDGLVNGGGGNGGGDNGGGLEPTIESIQTNVFNTSCALSNCHVGPGAAAGLNLSDGSARENLVGVRSSELPDFDRVEPGNADDSYLVMKLEGDDRIVGARMPLNRTPLTSFQISVVREWIDMGAD